MSAATWNNPPVTFSYSNVKNNFSVINDATFGKKMARLIMAYQYAGGGYYPGELHSEDLRDEVFSEGEYEVLPSRYFKKSFHSSLFPGGSYTSQTEFFFN